MNKALVQSLLEALGLDAGLEAAGCDADFELTFAVAEARRRFSIRI